MKILAKILATITGVPRYQVKVGVNFEWSSKSWTHNVFRVYELIFWKRYGIKKETTTFNVNGKLIHEGHSLEAKCAIFETKVRNRFSSLKFGAIAADATASGTYGTSPRTHSHTCTGSDLILMMSGFSFGSGTTSTYNGTSMTNLGAYTYGSTIRYGCLNYLISPSTGSNTLSFSPGGDGIAVTSSYSGVSSTGQPDAAINTQTTGTGSAASLTATVTVTASGSWLMAGTICEGNALTAGTGATLRITGSNVAVAFFDSNGAPGTGSQSMTVNESPASQLAMGMVSIAPVASAVFVFPARIIRHR